MRTGSVELGKQDLLRDVRMQKQDWVTNWKWGDREPRFLERELFVFIIRESWLFIAAVTSYHNIGSWQKFVNWQPRGSEMWHRSLPWVISKLWYILHMVLANGFCRAGDCHLARQCSTIELHLQPQHSVFLEMLQSNLLSCFFSFWRVPTPLGSWPPSAILKVGSHIPIFSLLAFSTLVRSHVWP